MIGQDGSKEAMTDDLKAQLNAVQEILASGGNDLRSFLYRDIVSNALRCEDLDILDLKIIDRVLAEFQHAACVFKPYRSIRKVSIFGSARVKQDSPQYQLAVQFGRAMAAKGYMVITGAAEGIMRA